MFIGCFLAFSIRLSYKQEDISGITDALNKKTPGVW